MHPALFVIIGFMGPLCFVGLIGIFYLLHDNKKKHSEQVYGSTAFNER